MSQTQQTQGREEERVKRLNIDVPESLHQRVKVGCALESKNMREVILEMLEQRFPAGKYERVKMEPIDLDFVTAGKITGLDWEFKRRAPGQERLHRRVLFYRWQGLNYVVWMRSQDLNAKYPVDLELNEMVRLEDAR